MNKNMKVLLATIFLLVVNFSSSFGQVKLKGTVKDEVSGQKLIGVNLYAIDEQKGTSTDSSGTFELEVKEAREVVNLRISYIGYKQKTIKANASEFLEISLKPTEITMSEQMVSGGFEETQKESPFPLIQIKGATLKNSGNLTLMQALSEAPGIEEMSMGPGIGKPIIRGLSFSRVMTLYEGNRFENQQWGADHGLGIANTGIEKVEVIKGPASVLYGSGAIGGVVNIISQKPPQLGTMTGNVDLHLHSNTLGISNEVNVARTEENGFFWAFNHYLEDHADFLDGNGRTIGNSRFNTQTLKATTGLLRTNSKTSFSYTHMKQELGIIEGDEMEEGQSLATSRNDRIMQLPYQRVIDHVWSLNHTQYFKNDNRLSFKTSFHRNYREEIEDALDEIDLGLILNTLNYDVNYTLNAGSDFSAIFGFQGFYQTNTNYDDADEILMPDAELFDNGVYSLLRWTPRDWILQAGFRYDQRLVNANTRNLEEFVLPGEPESEELSTDFSGFTSSFGATYPLNEQWSVHANLASGFRAPDLAEIFSNGPHPGTNRFERGNVNFEREQNYQADLSLRYSTPSLKAEINGFFNEIENYIFFVNTGEPIGDLILWEFQQDDARIYGGEAAVEWIPSAYDAIDVQLSYQMVRGLHPGSASGFLPMMPHNKIRTKIQWSPFQSVKSNPYLMVRTTNAFAQDNFAENEVRTPSFFLFDVALGTRLHVNKQAVDVQLMAANLFDEVYFEHNAVLRPFDITHMGRNIRLKVNLPFNFN